MGNTKNGVKEMKLKDKNTAWSSDDNKKTIIDKINIIIRECIKFLGAVALLFCSLMVFLSTHIIADYYDVEPLYHEFKGYLILILWIVSIILGYQAFKTLEREVKE